MLTTGSWRTHTEGREDNKRNMAWVGKNKTFGLSEGGSRDPTKLGADTLFQDSSEKQVKTSLLDASDEKRYSENDGAREEERPFFLAENKKGTGRTSRAGKHGVTSNDHFQKGCERSSSRPGRRIEGGEKGKRVGGSGDQEPSEASRLGYEKRSRGKQGEGGSAHRAMETPPAIEERKRRRPPVEEGQGL